MIAYAFIMMAGSTFASTAMPIAAPAPLAASAYRQYFDAMRALE
jgi:hypothetical protein